MVRRQLEVVSLRKWERVVEEERGIDEGKISERATKVRYSGTIGAPGRTLARTNGEPHRPADALHKASGN